MRSRLNSKVLLTLVCVLIVMLVHMIAFRMQSNHDAKPRTTVAPAGQQQKRMAPATIESTEEIDELNRRRAEREDLVNFIKSTPKTSRTADVIVIGTSKCGTETLKLYLGEHPSVVTGPEVEYYDWYRERGLEYYKSLLPNAYMNQLILDKTPGYFSALPINLPEIIKNDCPGVKIMVMLCEPTHRSFSEHTHRQNPLKRPNLNIKISYEEYISKFLPNVEQLFKTGHGDLENILRHTHQTRHETVILGGLYSMLLPRWTRAFSDDQFLIIDGEKFVEDPGQVIEEIEKFLSIPLIIRKEDFVINNATGLKCLVKWWRKGYTPSEKNNEAFYYCMNVKYKGRTRTLGSKYIMSPTLAERLDRFYQPFNQQLKKMVKKDFKWLN